MTVVPETAAKATKSLALIPNLNFATLIAL